MDKLSSERRSENMRRIKSKSTKPEMAVRRAAHRLGYRFRLHKKDLPGKPDLVFAGRRKVIFVHGCFWHGHDDPKCLDGRLPKSRTEYWQPKISRNRARDAAAVAALQEGGWAVKIIWECETGDEARLEKTIRAFLGGRIRKRP